MKKKIFLGITGNIRTISVNFSSNQEVTYIAKGYLDLIKDYENVIPIILTPDIDPKHAKDLCNTLDGIIFPGGEDIDPSSYGSENEIHYDAQIKDTGKPFHRPNISKPNKKRDLFEIELYKTAKEKDIPILGICRGMQLINVAEGGTLFQELPKSDIDHFIGNDGWIPYHDLFLEKDTKIHDIFKTDKYTISSIHHQAVNKLGNNLLASGTAKDGIIEIIEHPKHNFIIGVQGHMEKLVRNFPLYAEMVSKFIDRSRGKK
jgi:putative glutamine amidotransferase